MAQPRSALSVLILLGLAGCSQMLSWEPDVYIVQDGDTLYKIAWRYNLDYRDIAAWNDLGRGDLIYAGQRIRLAAPDGWSGRSASHFSMRRKVSSAALARGGRAGRALRQRLRRQQRDRHFRAHRTACRGGRRRSRRLQRKWTYRLWTAYYR